jgi:adenylate cyclase
MEADRMNDGPTPEDRTRCVIRFLPSERTLEIRAGEMTLLDAVKAAGLPIASACGSEGACARCGLEIVAGAETLEPESEREHRIKARNRIDPSERLACRVRPVGDLTVRAGYW